jgi:serine/threonine protein kinase
MNSKTADFEGLSREQEERLSKLMDDYLAGLEEGRPLSYEQLVARHPDLAEPLRAYVESLDFLQDVARGLRCLPESSGSGSAIDTDWKVLGDFQILREVGRGGMGVVYEARQVSLSRRVALKILPFAALLDPKHIARFRNEAQAAAQLIHPHIVPIFFVGADRGVHYYAMQFIDGQPLDLAIQELRRAAGILGGSPAARDDALDYEDKSGSAYHENGSCAEKPQPSNGKSGFLLRPALPMHAGRPTEARTHGHSRPNRRTLAAPESINCHHAVVDSDAPACRGADTADWSLRAEYTKSKGGYFRAIARLGIQAAKALHAAHEIGIVHRDVKPSNLLVDMDGNLWVTDFGVARCRSDVDVTKTGDLLGTMRYMSPEQANGQPHLVDHRTDIYQLGVTLYELLALRHPVPAEEPAAILKHLESEQPCRLRRLNPTIPVDLENIVHKSMRKSRDDRYTTAQEFADDLRRFLEGKPIVAKQPTVVERAGKWIRRHKVIASFVAVLVLAVLALLTSTTLLAYQKQATKRALEAAEESFHRYRTQLALTNTHLALLQEESGNSAQAEAAFEKAIRLQRQILEDQPDDEETLRDFAATLSNLSVFYAKRDPSRAARCYHETLSIQQRLVSADPASVQYRSDLALTHSNFGSFQARRNMPTLAVPAYRRAITILEQLCKETSDRDCDRDLAVCCNNLGITQDALGEFSNAEQSFRYALEVLDSSMRTGETTPTDFSSRGGVYNNLGMVLESQGQWRDAASAYLQAIQCQKKARDLAPQVGRFRDLLSKHCDNHARVLRRLGHG